MKVSTRALVEIPCDREAVFHYATDVANVPTIFRKLGLIPGVERAWVLGNGPTTKGAVRRLLMSDGTPLDEQVLEMEAPRKFFYRLKGFRGTFRALVKQAEGEWIFSPLGHGTRITWTFTAELTSPLAATVAVPLVKGAMKRSMEESLHRIKAAL
jgi:carbon monoxide dehydrogenase subunit G